MAKSKVERPSWDEYFIELTNVVAKRSNCESRKVGAIITVDNQIIATGYNGAPKGLHHCIDAGGCLRKKNNIESGTRQEVCRAVHAEQNAIISAARNKMIGSTLYLVGKDYNTGKYVENARPCALCKRMIINAGIEKVLVRDSKKKYTTIDVQEFIDNDYSLNGTLGY